MKKIRIGGGAGFAGDRVDPAVELAEKGEIDYLVFECLAERTIATDQLAKMTNPALGYNSGLVLRMGAVLPICMKKGIKIITNMGSANPKSAAQLIKRMCQKIGIKEVKIATVLGDDVFEVVKEIQGTIFETGENLDVIRDDIVSANAYIGAEHMAEALRQGADIVIVGRSADPSLFLAPMMYEFNWSSDDYHHLGIGTVLGHLLECAGQVTGGYFADPGYKDVPGLDLLGFPICEVYENGEAFITKVPGSGGIVSVETCQEQMLYEIHDPSAYITPDVVANFMEVEFIQVAPDIVKVIGGNGAERTDTLKVSIGYHDGFIGEGELTYAGPGAVDRAKLAVDIIQKRIEVHGLIKSSENRFDLIGINSIHLNQSKPAKADPYEIRIRVACRTESKAEAAKVGQEIYGLLTNGPSGGAGNYSGVRDIIAILSVLIPRDSVKVTIEFV